MVLLRNSKRESKKGDKMQPKWRGPYIIVDIIGKGLYSLKNPNTNQVLSNLVHSQRLKKYYQSAEGKRQTSTTSDTIVDDKINGMCLHATIYSN